MTDRTESLLLSVLTAKGAEARAAAFIAAVLPLAAHAYKHGSRREQWEGKPTAARPLRGPWLAAFGTDKAPNTATFRAFRAVCQAVAAVLANSKRDKSDDAAEAFAEELELLASQFFAGTPAKKREADPRAPIAKAIRVLQDAGATLSDADVDALRAVLASRDAMLAAAAADAIAVAPSPAPAPAPATV